MSDETWLKRCNVDASRNVFFVATRILSFDFELFLGERCRFVIDYLKSKGVLRVAAEPRIIVLIA
jgi:hypothetical protein